MAIKRYIASADTTVTNAYRQNLVTRGTSSNMGLADSLEVFNIYQQQSSSSIEQARILVQFPISTISSDRTAGTIPVSSSVSFYLKMYNVRHSQTLPKDFKVQINAISQSWSEGRGVDMDEYQDVGEPNWVSASSTSRWQQENAGVTYVTGASEHPYPVYTGSFTNGTEDLEVNITDLVEQWIGSVKGNYGVVIKMSASQGGLAETFYTKKFSARSSEFFFKKPAIEARWDSRTTDDRGNFYYSSSLAPASDNLNTLYLYNIVRGRLRNIPGVDSGSILVSIYSGSSENTVPHGSKLKLYNTEYNLTGGYISTGIYTCSVGLTASSPVLTRLFDVWHSGTTEYATASITPIVESAEMINPSNRYVLSIKNLKSTYQPHEAARFRLFSRKKNWSPTIYSKATSEVVGQIIESASYSIYRTVDDLNVIAYGTGSNYHTFLSYDKSGSFFDLDMSMFEPGYQYAIRFSFYNDSAGGWQQQPYKFKFRVEEI